MEKLEQLFFEEIIKEASQGHIDCDFLVPIGFNAKEVVNGRIVDLTQPKNFDNIVLPTLIVKDREKLLNSMANYLRLSRTFYNHDPKLNDTSVPDKYLLTLLLSNALVTDFNDLNRLYDRHSEFISDTSMDTFLQEQNIGYSNYLKSDIYVKIVKKGILLETPYGLESYLKDDEGNIVYEFPTVMYGISNEGIYIYAIQGNGKNDNKKIERLLRKTGEGFDEANSSRDPIADPENLYSVSPWSLVALSIALPILKNCSSKNNVIAPYLLINRYNSKTISYEILKEKYDGITDPIVDKILVNKKEQLECQDDIQRNITDKFIRTFRRIEHHFDNINIDNFQLEMDSSLHLHISDELNCNNSLLNEVYSLANQYTSKKKEK